jgi:hypothetical protein
MRSNLKYSMPVNIEILTVKIDSRKISTWERNLKHYPRIKKWEKSEIVLK